MVIYDKNQFRFNMLFAAILIALIVINLSYHRNFRQLERELEVISSNLSKVEQNQNFNFIQAPHYELEYQQTPIGFCVLTADDFGKLNGPSMQPSIFDGHTMIQKKYDGNMALREGQIVRFVRDNGTAVIHRVRSDYGGSVYVQGDSLKEGEIIQKSRITHLIIGVLFT